MERIILLALLLTGPAWAGICEERITILDKELSKCWAKEYAGLDLVRDLVKRDRENTSKPKSQVAVFDLGFERDHISLTEEIEVPPQMNGRRTMRAHHGTSVVNLLTGPEEMRMTDEVSLIGLGGISHAFQYNYFFKNFEETGRLPKIISNSLGWNDPKISEVVERAYQRNVLWLLAAGNGFPRPVKELEISSKALLIGSFAPNGLTSYETQIDKRMLILAPANKELLTLNGYGEPHLFGATSGATPVVAATLTNITFYLPEITREQVWILLRKSGQLSTENKIGLKDHPPLLNAYKAVRVAKKISNECENESDEEACIDQLLNDSTTYQIQDLDMDYGTEEKNLRARALLGDRMSTESLIKKYENMKLYWNSEYFRFLLREKISLPKLEAWTREAIDEGLYEYNSFRYFPLYSQETRDYAEMATTISDHHKKTYLNLIREDLGN